MELSPSKGVHVQLNTTLVSLELNSNSIDYDGATAIAEAISENNSLTSLFLRCSSFLSYVHLAVCVSSGGLHQCVVFCRCARLGSHQP